MFWEVYGLVGDDVRLVNVELVVEADRLFRGDVGMVGRMWVGWG